MGPKLRAIIIAKEHLDIAWMLEFVFDRVKRLWKKEKMQVTSLFSAVFSTGLFLGVVEFGIVWADGKGL